MFPALDHYHEGDLDENVNIKYLKKFMHFF